MSQCLGVNRNIGCKDKNSPWNPNGFLNIINNSTIVGPISGIISGINPAFYCTLTLIAMQVHQNRGKNTRWTWYLVLGYIGLECLGSSGSSIVESESSVTLTSYKGKP